MHAHGFLPAGKSSKRFAAQAVVTLSCFGLVILGVALFGTAGHDDSHITYWSAHTLTEFGKIINYNGEVVEPSSSIGFVLIIALLSVAIPVSIPTIAWISGYSFAVATVVAAVRLAARLGCTRPELAAPLVASTMSFAYWATSGMETSMAAFAAILAVDAIRGFMVRGDARRLIWAFTMSVFFVACRPENAIILPCLGCAAVVVSSLSVARTAAACSSMLVKRAGVIVFAMSFSVPMLFFAFRWLAFRRFFPNPVGVKSGIPFDGLLYVFDGLAENNPLLLPLLVLVAWISLLGLVRGAEVNVGRELAVAYIVAASSFAVAVGGDWMSGGRFVFTMLPIGWVLIVGAVQQRVSAKHVVTGVVGVLVCGNLIMTVQFARDDDRNRGRPGLVGWAVGEKFRSSIEDFELTEISNKSHLRDAILIGEITKTLDKLLMDRDDPVWIMSDLAGMVPYHVFRRFYGRVRFIDWYSITMRRPLSNCLPEYRLQSDLLGTYAQLEHYLDGTLADCGVPIPDVFYSSFSTNQDLEDFRVRLDRLGFTVTYMQTGRITSPRSGRVLSSTTPLPALVAVRRELLPLVDDGLQMP